MHDKLVIKACDGAMPGARVPARTMLGFGLALRASARLALRDQ